MKNKQIIDSWNKIAPDSTADERMLTAILAHNCSGVTKKESIMNRQGIKKFPRLASALCAVVLIAGLTAGVAFADNIKSFIGTVLSFDSGTKYPISDIATVNINDTAIKDSDLIMTVSEAEQMLGVNILTSEKSTSDMLVYRPLLSKNGNIARVDLWYADFINYDNANKQIDETNTNNMANEEYQALMAQRKYLSMSVAFVTPYAGDEYIGAFAEGLDATGGKKVDARYELSNLGVEAVLYTNDWSDTRLTATFVYDDMLYTVIGNNVPKDEMLDILSSLR